MGNITTDIDNIRHAVYGREVRESIADAIEQVYEDATHTDPADTNLEVIQARSSYTNLNARENAQDAAMAAETSARMAADTTLQNNINAEASARATQDSVLSARMDTFSSLPSGSTSGNAELLDIRVGANGTTYPTAGDAVRGQFNDLKSTLQVLETHVVKVESGSFASNHLTKVNNTGFIRSKTLIPISAFKSIVLPSGYKMYVFYFDANVSYLGATASNATRIDYPVTTYPTARYANMLIMKIGASGDISGDVGTVQNGLTIVPLFDIAFTSATLVSNTTTLADFNSAVVNRVYSINITTLSNMPVARKGYLLTFGINGGANTISGGSGLQMYLAEDGYLYTRYVIYGSPAAFTAWIKNAKYDDAGVGSFIGAKLVNSTTDLADLNNAKINSFYSINATNIPNMPIASKGNLLYFGLNGWETTPLAGRACQFYIALPSLRVFVRGVYFGSSVVWSDWKELTQNNCYPDISLFETLGVIGDSYASGDLYTTGSSVAHYNLSWPQILGRSAGINVTNYTSNGVTSMAWLSIPSHGKASLEADPAKQLYVIALGINDTSYFGTSNIGSTSDLVEGSTSETFYRYMGEIYRVIKNHAPNAIIIFSTIARFGSDYDSFSAAIKSIANYYNCPCLDLSNSEFFKSSFFSTNQTSGHPQAIVYSGMAKAYKTMIEEYMQNHPTMFASFAG